MHEITDCFNIFLIPPILFLITGVTLGVFSLIKGKRNYENILFALTCFWFSLIMPAFIAHHLFKGDIELIMKIERSIHFFYVYGPPILILFVHSLVNKKNRIIEAGAFAISFIISLSVFTNYYFYGLWEFRWGYIAKGGIFFHIFGLWAICAIIYSLVLSVKKLKTNIDDHARMKIKYIMFAILSIGILTLGNMAALNGIDFYPPGNFAFIPIIFMAWGIYRHDVIKINLYAKKRIIGVLIKTLVVTTLLAAIPVTFCAIDKYTLDHIISRTIPYGLPPLFSFVCSIFLSFLSIKLGENRKDSIIFSVFILVYALLSLDIYLNCIITIPENGLRVSRLSHIFVVFLNPLSMHLIREVTNRNSEKFLLTGNYFFSILLMLFTQSDWYLKGMNQYSWGQFAKNGVLFDIMSIVSFLTIIYNIIILTDAYRKSRQTFYRQRFFFLLTGTAIMAAISLGDIPAMNGYDIYPSGNFIFIPSTMFAIALFRYNFNELLRLTGLFLYYGFLAAGVSASVYFITAIESEKNQPLYALIAVSGILLFTVFLRTLRKTLNNKNENKLKTSFEKLNIKLSRARSIDELTDYISNSFFTDLSSGHCAVLIYDKEKKQYTGQNRTNTFSDFIQRKPGTDCSSEIVIDEMHPLLNYIETTYSPIKPEEIELVIFNRNLVIDIKDPLRKAERVLPVFFENRLSAIILLGIKTNGSLYSKNENEFLYQLGIILGPHIENTMILQGLEETLKKRTEELRRSEEKYSTILNTNNVGFFEFDLEGNITSCNDVFLSYTGYTKDEALNMNFSQFINPEIYDKTFAIYHQVFKKEISIGSIEHEVIRKDGFTGYVETTISRMTDENGKITGFRTIAIDIGKRKLAEAALLENESKYRHFIENTNEMVFKADWKGNFIYSNPAFQKKFGYTFEEINNLNYLNLVPPENRESESAYYMEYINKRLEESHRELPAMTKSGKILWVELNVKSLKDTKGRVYEFDCIVHDITERKAAEDALRESEKHYQQLMENVNDCVFICKHDGHFKYINQAVTRLTGISNEELTGKHFLSIVHPDYREQMINFFQNQINENIEVTYYEFPLIIKNHGLIWVAQTVRMIKNNEGEIEFYGVTRDISSRKKEEDARRDLEEAKDRFFSNISHEIRTPLTLMLGPIESVLRGDYDNEIDNEFFRILHRNTTSLLKLVNNLLDFSKITEGKMLLRVQEGDIVQFARHYLSTLELAGKTRHINLELNSSSESIMLYFDPEKMDKVFMNLLSNALKFTEQDGTISITLEESPEQCRIMIADTGEGIPEKNINTIFDRFSQSDSSSTRKYEGTGIGLALVKELVELHGGTIEVESRYIDRFYNDHGTVFTLSFPVGMDHFRKRPNIVFSEKTELGDFVRDYRLIDTYESEESELINSESRMPPRDTTAHPHEKEKTILVVDDNKDMRNFLKILLQKYYNVIFAENGERGLESARYLRPDLIVTDVMMPVMNGFDMTSIIKTDAHLRSTPVIMLTADTDLMNKVSGLENGADDYLHKPFNSLELLTRISSLLKNYENQQIISRRNADIESELEIARMLQKRLLPSSMPEISGYHEHAIYIPMDKVGGDFYNIDEHEGYLNVFIADVSGHGLPGAFLATITKIALDHITEQKGAGKVLCLLNDVILQHTVRSNFVTAFFASIDTKTNVMQYASAGHPASIVYRRKDDEFIELQTKGTPLGLFHDTKIEEDTVQLASGDRIIFYTDGITECANESNEQFGEDRFKKMIKKYSNNSSETFSDELLKELKIFCGSCNYDDDITMVVIDVL